MVARFAREIWERFHTAGRRPRRRGSRPRPRHARRLIESLEPRVLLSAEVGSYRPVAIMGRGPIATAEVGPVATAAATPGASRASTLWAWDDAGHSIGSSNHPGFAASGFASLGPTSIGPASPSPADVGLPPEDGPPTPDELATLPRAPWSPSYSYAGSMDDLDATAIRIPVGPSTRALTFGLKAERVGDDAPRIDKVFLFDRDGGLLSRIGGVSVLGPDGEQVLHVSVRGAPIGGEIVVFLAPPGPSPASPFPGGSGDETIGGGAPAAGTAPAWGGETYFQLSIQRDDDGDLDGGAAEPTTADGGASYIATLGRVEVSTSIDRSPPTVDATPPSIGPGPRGPVVTVGARRSNVRIDAIDYGPEEVFLGPLVSRAAAAMGPVLATDVDEPTPAIGRGARSTVDAQTFFGSDLELEEILAATGRGGLDGRAGPAGADAALSALRGPGGVPIVVAGLRLGDDSVDAEDDLAATVLGAARDVPPPVDLPTADAGRDDVARAGFATRALGFLVGMCLASGPLYPDLAALARRKFRRGRRRAAAGRSTAGRLNSGRA